MNHDTPALGGLEGSGGFRFHKKLRSFIMTLRIALQQTFAHGVFVHPISINGLPVAGVDDDSGLLETQPEIIIFESGKAVIETAVQNLNGLGAVQKRGIDIIVRLQAEVCVLAVEPQDVRPFAVNVMRPVGPLSVRLPLFVDQ